MKFCTPRLLALAAAALALNACSSEPSDWRPDEKVSVDMVAPGTRSDEVFRTDSADMPNAAKSAAIPRPINSSEKLDERAMPDANETTSADAASLKGEEKMNDASQAKEAADDRSAGGKPKR
ncbi:hypothetical protein ACFQ48_06325 [Hymenobacter caeli]|uniref:DUF3035 domain-containing protein n=1 Tax=Hymenobacter caeli TaxID=2735894 RepID=A0ABX2FNP6_9BACT|nr:hypothetical protein [Hymenobacter caeli]NRT18796.1 hypothetical protein [Hymenobacter caeli]